MVTSSKGQSQRVEHMLESSYRSRLLRTVKISLPADPVSSELTHIVVILEMEVALASSTGWGDLMLDSHHVAGDKLYLYSFPPTPYYYKSPPPPPT
ncbi:hypothetical protein AAC387_Pa05g2166 [Persea americana]